MSERKIYVFDGSVKHFEQTIRTGYTSKTMAVSPKQALNNICYKYKKIFGYKANTKLTLHGCLRIQGEEDYVYTT